MPARVPLVIGTSGTAAALAEACAAVTKAGKQGSKRSRRGGKRVGAESALTIGAGLAPTPLVRKLAKRLARMTLPEREAVPGIGPRRAEIIVAGAQVFAELLESFGLAGFRYSPLGLRDGILAQMLAEQDARATAHREFEHERWESVLATARRYGVDPRQAEPVRAHAVQLFRELKALHQLPAEYESWLAAAAMLRDTGKFINHQGHHRHTQYIVSSSEIYGYTQVQRTHCFGHCALPGQEPAAAGRPRAAQHSRGGTQECASRRGAAAAGGGAEPGPRQRCAAGGGARLSASGFIWSSSRDARAPSWNCGRCAKRRTTSARSSGGSFLPRWHRWRGPCADR